VWFGERWITSIFDLFEENVRYFPALLAECSDEDPVAVLESGRAPELEELRLHNGTVYRWNRPIYDTVGGQPHLRVENRVLPAGPTIRDVMANAAFYYGLVRVLANEDRPVWTQMSFAAAEQNFRECARRGIESRVYWPGFGEVGIDELVLRHLLPLAYQGLADWGVSTAVMDRYLTVIEGRATAGVNGATWQADTVAMLEEQGLDRAEALRRMLELYVENMHTNEPVHTWRVG
ncbi:MAG: glutamate--cysteine ligase, partial [Tetrasphaera sp.]|nr:glutamate--cysteine ligase [Tetrasphaera sp.]